VLGIRVVGRRPRQVPVHEQAELHRTLLTEN
jgi:hypothetical protein